MNEMEPTKELPQPSRFRGKAATLGSSFGFKSKVGINTSSGAFKPQEGPERLASKDISQSGSMKQSGVVPAVTKSRFGFKPKVAKGDYAEVQGELKNGSRGDSTGANSSIGKESAGVKAYSEKSLYNPMASNSKSYSKSKSSLAKEESDQGSVQDKPEPTNRSKFASLASRFQSKSHSFSNSSKKIQNGEKISPNPGQSSTLQAEDSGKISKLTRPVSSKQEQTLFVRASAMPSRSSSYSLGSKEHNGSDKIASSKNAKSSSQLAAAKSSNQLENSKTFGTSMSFGQIQVPKSLQLQAPRPSSNQQVPIPSSSQLQYPVSQLRGPKSSSSLVQPSKSSYSQPQLVRPSSSQLQQPRPSLSQAQASKLPADNGTAVRPLSSEVSSSGSSSSQQPSIRTSVPSLPKAEHQLESVLNSSINLQSDSFNDEKHAFEPFQESKSSSKLRLGSFNDEKNAFEPFHESKPSSKLGLGSFNDEKNAFEPFQESKPSSKLRLASVCEETKGDQTSPSHNIKDEIDHKCSSQSFNNANELLEELPKEGTKHSTEDQLSHEAITQMKETNNNKSSLKLKKSSSKSAMMTVTNGKPRRTKPIEMYLSRLGSVVKSVRKSSSSSSVISDVSSPIEHNKTKATAVDEFIDEKDKGQNTPDEPDLIGRPASQPMCPTSDSDSNSFHVHFTNSSNDNSPTDPAAFVHFDSHPFSSEADQILGQSRVQNGPEVLEISKNGVVVDWAKFKQMDDDVDNIKMKLLRLEQVLLGDMATDSGIDSQSEESVEDTNTSDAKEEVEEEVVQTHQSNRNDWVERTNQENTQLKREILLLRQQLEEKDVVIQNLKESLKVSVLTFH